MVDASIDVLDRGRVRMDSNFVVEADVIATLEDPNPDLRFVEVPVYNLVIDHPEGTVLWDTGSHHEAGEGHWPAGLYNAFPHEDACEHRLDDDLAEAGYGLEDVDYVFQTHLHMDHAGGLEFFAGTDTPVFVHERELKFAYYSAKTREGNAGYVAGDFDHELNWHVLHGERGELFEGVEYLHLPGHTPGQLGTAVHLDGGTVVFTGDQIEVAENYERGIPPGPGLVVDRRAWFESLRWLKDIERRRDAEMVFGHDLEQFHDVEDGW